MEIRETNAAWRARDVLALVLLCAFTLLVLVPSLHDVNYGTESDDAVYLGRATRIASDGVSVLPETFREYIERSELWQLPSPVRLGYPVLCALVFQLVEPSYHALSCLSIACWVATVAIQFVFVRRRYGFERGVLIGALTACSCLGLGLARLALLDGPVTPFLVLAAWTFLERLERAERARDCIVRADPARDCIDRADPARAVPSRAAIVRGELTFIAAATAAILIKEPSVLLLPPLALFAAWERFGRRTPVPVLRIAALLAAPAALSFAVWIAAAGGVGPFVETLRIVRETLKDNVYAQRFLAGPWYRYVVDFLVLSPWTTLGALAGAGWTLARWRRGEYERGSVFLLFLLGGLLAEFGAIEKNVRYVLVAEMGLRVLALLFVWDLLATWSARARLTAASVIVALVCWSEIASFQHVFVRWRTYETVSWHLFALRELIPAHPGAGK